jgi:hypothetical protein
MGQALLCNSGTAHEHAEMLLPDGGMHSPIKFSSLTTLSNKELNDSHPLWADTSLGMPERNRVTLVLLFAVVCPYCCTSCGLLQMCHNLQMAVFTCSAADGFHLNKPHVY